MKLLRVWHLLFYDDFIIASDGFFKSNPGMFSSWVVARNHIQRWVLLSNLERTKETIVYNIYMGTTQRASPGSSAHAARPQTNLTGWGTGEKALRLSSARNDSTHARGSVSHSRRFHRAKGAEKSEAIDHRRLLDKGWSELTGLESGLGGLARRPVRYPDYYCLTETRGGCKMLIMSRGGGPWTSRRAVGAGGWLGCGWCAPSALCSPTASACPPRALFALDRLLRILNLFGNRFIAQSCSPMLHALHSFTPSGGPWRTYLTRNSYLMSAATIPDNPLLLIVSKLVIVEVSSYL